MGQSRDEAGAGLLNGVIRPNQASSLLHPTPFRLKIQAIMVTSIRTNLLLLLGAQLTSIASATTEAQVPLGHGSHHAPDPAMLHALKLHPDPVDALIFLQPEMAKKLAEPRLLRIAGEKEARMLTEGDKMRLRRNHTKFADITDYQDLYDDKFTTMAGKAREYNTLDSYS